MKPTKAVLVEKDKQKRGKYKTGNTANDPTREHEGQNVNTREQ